MKKDIRYVPTPPLVVETMLDMSELSPGDRLYDLGCGDGRILIAAAARGVQGVGIDIDPSLIARCRENARTAGCEELVHFEVGDLFRADLRPASVVTLYLLGSVNERLKPRLTALLRPGTRVVSHSFAMGDWEPDLVAMVEAKIVYRWTVS